MDGPMIVTVLSALTAAVCAIAAAIVSVINAIRTPRMVQGVANRVDVLTARVDGRLTQLLNTIADESRAAGFAAAHGVAELNPPVADKSLAVDPAKPLS